MNLNTLSADLSVNFKKHSKSSLIYDDVLN